MVDLVDLLDQAGERLIVGSDTAAHQFGGAHSLSIWPVVVEPSTASIDMNDTRVFIGRAIMEGLTGGHKLKRRVACAAKPHQNPDCRQTIEIRSEMPHDGGQLLHGDETRFPDLAGVRSAYECSKRINPTDKYSKKAVFRQRRIDPRPAGGCAPLRLRFACERRIIPQSPAHLFALWRIPPLAAGIRKGHGTARTGCNKPPYDEYRSVAR
jgi:hypothetical protein